MKKVLFNSFIFVLILGCNFSGKKPARLTLSLDKAWLFHLGDLDGAVGNEEIVNLDEWQVVEVPHDWAISGDFDKNNDPQSFIVIEDGEEIPTTRYGRTGGLPHMGVGWYRKSLDIPLSFRNKRIHLEFDGAMSHAKIYMNGKYVGEWPYGYASFGFDVTDYVSFGKENILAVRLENKPNSSRWYPGAGIYRNVRMVITNPIHIKQWGTFVTTPGIAHGKGVVNIKTALVNKAEEIKTVTIKTEIVSPDGVIVASNSKSTIVDREQILEQELMVNNPSLWSINQPLLYSAITRIIENGKELDTYNTAFGFRFFEFTANGGFFLNGENLKLKGVCMHHDLGPLGAAVNYSALKRQLVILQEMGCNAIRTSHNPPTPELLQLTDEMGFLVIDEAFDEWKHPKLTNGYHTLWDEWAEKDLVSLIHRDRNHPSVIMWSIGNEIREQGIKGGEKYCQFLVDICKREDPTRPTTAGFNNWEGAIENGFADIVDVPGWNYKPQYYNFIHQKFPHWKMYGSETASTVSSRGEYFFPAEVKVHFTREPYHSSSYDLEYARWATSPDSEFAAQDSFPFIAGEFVWTGFDYLGEPTPYNIEWPARSSYFGIIDLCGIPKDRYYLYQSKWSNKEVLHLLPHWNWEGKEGEIIPVHCYTNFEKAELFLNGMSLGVQQKDSSQLYRKYRLVWDVPYQPGELKVVALSPDEQPMMEAKVQTAGKPYLIKLETDQTTISADGKELAFVTVSVVDERGIFCPRASNQINIKVEGEGKLKAIGSGDPTSLEPFVRSTRKLFNGKCIAYIQSTENSGQIKVVAESDGLASAQLIINTK